MLEEIDELLELALLEKADLPLILSQSMFMSILEGIWAIEKWVVLAEELEKCIFANSLTGATIQDGGKRERSDLKENMFKRENNLKENK